MFNKLKNLKLNIRQRVLFLIFGCCLFTFLVMMTVSFHSFLDIQDSVRAESNTLNKNLSNILQSPEKFNPHKLANLRDLENIFIGEPYITYSPNLLKQGISAELANEIDLASNIADTLAALSKSYQGYQASFPVASRKGYFICADVMPTVEDSRGVYLTEERNRSFPTYEPRERPWYKLTEKEMRLV